MHRRSLVVALLVSSRPPSRLNGYFAVNWRTGPVPNVVRVRAVHRRIISEISHLNENDVFRHHPILTL